MAAQIYTAPNSQELRYLTWIIGLCRYEKDLKMGKLSWIIVVDQMWITKILIRGKHEGHIWRGDIMMEEVRRKGDRKREENKHERYLKVLCCWL